MKIKEVSVGVKLTKNYDSYQASLTAELEDEEVPEKIGELLMEKSLAIVKQKLNFEKSNNEIEVGAAWISKESKDNLSVQYSKGGIFENVDISNLKKTDNGFKQIIGKDIFIFKKLSEKERTNNKMPVYRIYKIGGKNE